MINKGGTYPDGFLVALDGFSLNVLGRTRPSVPTIAFQGVKTPLSRTTPDIFHQSDNVKVPQQILFAYDVLFANPLGTFPATERDSRRLSDTGITVLGEGLSATDEFFFTAQRDALFHQRRTRSRKSGKRQRALAQRGSPAVHGDTGRLGRRAHTRARGSPVRREHLGRRLRHRGRLQIYPGAANLSQPEFRQGRVDRSIRARQRGDPATGRPARRRFLGDTVVDGQRSHPQQLQLRSCPCPPEGHRGDDKRGERKGVLPLVGNSDCRHRLGSGCHLSESKDGGGNPIWPKAVADDHTIPLLRDQPAANFNDTNDPEFKTGGSTGTGANNQTIAIATGDTQWSYFGCYLDVNDPGNDVNGTPIWQAFPGTHHCLVAEIAFAGTPIQIVNGIVPTPEGSGLLAQRNLQVTTSDNPGPTSAHRVPQTFATKPSAPPPLDGTARRTARRAAYLLGRNSGGLDGADLLARRLGGRGGHTRQLDVRRASAARRRPAYDRGQDRQRRHLRTDSGGYGRRSTRDCSASTCR